MTQNSWRRFESGDAVARSALLTLSSVFSELTSQLRESARSLVLALTVVSPRRASTILLLRSSWRRVPWPFVVAGKRISAASPRPTGGQLISSLANLEGEETFEASYLGTAEEVIQERISTMS